jgi:protein CSF1
VLDKLKELPCRFKVTAEGVEWFIYNRTPAYDDIIKQMMPGLDEMSPSSPAQNKGLVSVDTPDNKGTSPSPNEHPPQATVSPSVLQVVSRWFAIVNAVGVGLVAQIPSFEWGNLLPIGIAIIRGAIVIGNDSTPTILIGDFKLASVTVGTSPVNIFVFCLVLLLSCSPVPISLRPLQTALCLQVRRCKNLYQDKS